MIYVVVMLANGELVVVKEEWIQQSPSSKTKVFYGPDQNAIADFSVETKYFFKKNETACYKADICKRFGKAFFLIGYSLFILGTTTEIDKHF